MPSNKNTSKFKKITVNDILKPKNGDPPLPPELREYLKIVISNHLKTCGI
jgi:hypothetical protein